MSADARSMQATWDSIRAQLVICGAGIPKSNPNRGVGMSEFDVIYYHGKYVCEMNREELVQTINYLGAEIGLLRREQKAAERLESILRPYRARSPWWRNWFRA